MVFGVSGDDLVSKMEALGLARLTPWLSFRLFGNSLLELLCAATLFLTTWLTVRLLRRYFMQYLQRRRSAPGARDVVRYGVSLLERIRPGVIPLVAFAIATRPLQLAPTLGQIIRWTTLVVVTAQFIMLLGDLLGFLIRRSRLSGRENDAIARASAQNIDTMVRLALWGVGVLFVLDNAGVNISTFVAGLGIGGIAIALAAQTILGEMFSSFAIAVDKPFEVGDSITVDTFSGTVEYIGFKTTRVRSVNGEMMIFSNTDLTKSRIRNFKKMVERRILFQFRVAHTTPLETLQALPTFVRQTIEATAKTRFGRAHFAQLSEAALIFEVEYFVTTPLYVAYMDAQQEINLRLFEHFQKLGIAIGVPTQAVQLLHEQRSDDVRVNDLARENRVLMK